MANSLLKHTYDLAFSRVTFAICPTGSFCREDRCQSFFKASLIPTVRAPLEECESAGGVRSAGGLPILIDCPQQGISGDMFLKKLSESLPQLIVLSVTFSTLEADLIWAKRIKYRLPNTNLCIRGAPCYVFPKDILTDNSWIDFLVFGDYEITFEQIAIKGFREAAGVTYLRDGEVVTNPPVFANDLDELPLPSREIIDKKLYTVRGLRKPQATIHVQRGCPYPCSYCLVHTVSGSKARHRSAKSIASEITSLQTAGTNYFYLRAETFTLDRDWALAVSKELSQLNPKPRWVTTTRIERVDDELLAAMKLGGCYGISFGVDVVNDEISKRVNKKADLRRAKEAFRACDRHGILSLAYFMIGFLWDTKDTLKETKQFIKKCRPDLITVHYAHPYPGTKYHADVQRHQAKISTAFPQAEPALLNTGLSQSQLKSAGRSFLWSHYRRPSVLISLARKVLGNTWPKNTRRT